MAIKACIDDLNNQNIWKVQEFGHIDNTRTRWLAFEYSNNSALLVIEYSIEVAGDQPGTLESKVVLTWEFGMPEELIDLFRYYTPIS